MTGHFQQEGHFAPRTGIHGSEWASKVGRPAVAASLRDAPAPRA